MHKQTIDTEAWLKNLLAKRHHENPTLISQAVRLAQITGEDKANPAGSSCLAEGLVMAEILDNLHVDGNTLAAAILFSSVQYADLALEDVEEHLGAKVARLIRGTKQMEGISELYRAIRGREQYKHNVDNIRKMLLAMVDDIRVVLLKIAEHLFLLRSAAIFSDEKKKQIATETMAIYAPLTNRLGIAQLKWELEDIAFCYLEPEKYQEIAQALNEKFPERENYVKQVIEQLSTVLTKAQLHDFKVTGRTKHVYSIYRKMQRKNVGLAGIYDVSAVRIFVNNITDCYTALSHVHASWQYIPEEFDDYIAVPKPNGYASIHTAIFGPQNKIVEIQIRTYDMHAHAELGIAAHWIYKEGQKQKVDYEAKIAWLRQVMDWQQEITSDERTLNEVRQLFNDRVYIFTPDGDILDLPQGATPLDFAYQVHSEVGNKCVGAKINGNIVPLTHLLKIGERVEILTTKDGRPSRDWLNINLGYLKTSRARAKVFHWFKKQSQEKSIAQGQLLLEKELHRLGIKKFDLSGYARKLNFKSNDDFFAALGCGDIRLGSVINLLEKDRVESTTTPPLPPSPPPPVAFKRKPAAAEIKIHGIDNLLIHLANCCKPVPGDAIIGYITQGRGVSVHRDDCINVLYARKHRPEKLLFVSWDEQVQKRYPVDVIIKAYDRSGLIRDITNILAEENIAVRGLELMLEEKERIAQIDITIEIAGLTPLSKVLHEIMQIPNVFEARRKGV